MNNIQKNFKAKRGLCMAQGGLIDQLDPTGQMSRMDLGALTNDPTVLNAAMDREGLAAEQARQAKYPGQTFMNPVAQPQRQAAPQQAAQLQPQQPLDKFREPAPTSFEQDNNARGLRIQGYGDQLAGMRKERLGLADGTANVVQAAQPESAEQVMARMAAKYGVSSQPTAAPVQAPQPVQQAPQPAPQRQGLMGAAMGLIGGRKAAIDRATGYAEGGIVRGAGGPTDDEVPMQVAGKDVNLSNSEAVLPVKTVQALGGPEAVEHLIETTNGKPPVRGGLRAGGDYNQGGVFTRDGVIYNTPGQAQAALPNPNPPPAVPEGNAVAVRNNTGWTSGNGGAGAGGFKADPGAIDAEFRTVQPPQAQLAAPVQPVQPPAPPSMPHRAGQAVRGLAKQAWANKGAIAGSAGDAYALYNAHKLGEGQDEFSNDPSVPTLDKAKQFGRNVVKQAVPFAAGAIGSGVAGGTTFGAGAIAGGVGGYALGKLATAGVDEEGPELTAWRANNQGPRGLHRANMVDGPGNGTFEMPEFDTRGGDKELRAARKNGREGEPADTSPQGLLAARIAQAEANPNADPRQIAHLRNSLTYQRMDPNGKQAVDMGAQVGSVQEKYGATVGRDLRGQLVVAGGHQYTPEQHEAFRAQEAQRTTENLSRQVRGMERDRNVRDTQADITDPNVVRVGRENLARMDKEDATTTQAAQAKEEMGLKRDTLKEATGLRRDALGLQERQLGQQDRQFNQTLDERKEIALAAAREKGITNMTSMLDKSGYKDQEQVDFMDFVMQNHADNLSALSHAEQLKVLPRLKSDYQDMKVRNANSTNGTSWKNGKRVKTDKLDYEKDAAIDPTGVIDNKIWFGDGSDGKGLGKANIFARKNLPPVFFGADDVDVMDNGQRIMKKDNRGARGPQGSIDMREINRLSLRDAAK